MPCVSLQRTSHKFQEESSDLETQLLELGFLCDDWNVADPDALLEPETFTTVTAYDALNRATSIRTPHNAGIPASEILPAYNEASLLESVNVKLRGAATATNFVSDIDYDAKGQRERIQYGNGSTTGYTYDEKTFRLKRLLTTRNNGADILQDLNYTYDAAGNIAQIDDAAQQTIFFNGSVVSPSQKFEYDALYRLVKATGREHVSVNADGEPEAEGYNAAQISPQDGSAMRNYSREWEYDSVGNILSMIHKFNGSQWTRRNAYATDSNRLTSSTVGSASANFSYNAHGSMASMPHLSAMDWDFAEKLCHITRGTTEAYYNYDGSGIRTRKVVEKNGVVETRLYLGGIEIWRKTVNGVLDTERETLHVMDDQRRIALVETLTVENGNAVSSPVPVLRYQLDNHLGSASLELDDSASIISYEEYYPYGDTSYRTGRSASEVSQKRYRYTGKEKDEESGLYYHGARYYACWLGRWTAADPIGIGDGLNVYMYVHGTPLSGVDPSGTQGEYEFEAYPSDYGQRTSTYLPGSETDRLTPESTFEERKRFVERHGSQMYEPNPDGQRWIGDAENGYWITSELGWLKPVSEQSTDIETDGDSEELLLDEVAVPNDEGDARGIAESKVDKGGIFRSILSEGLDEAVKAGGREAQKAMDKLVQIDSDIIETNEQDIKNARRTASMIENIEKSGVKLAEGETPAIMNKSDAAIKGAEKSISQETIIKNKIAKFTRIGGRAIPIASAAIELTVNRVTQNNPWGRDLLTVGAGTVAAAAAGSLASGLILSFGLAVAGGYIATQLAGSIYDRFH